MTRISAFSVNGARTQFAEVDGEWTSLGEGDLLDVLAGGDGALTVPGGGRAGAAPPADASRLAPLRKPGKLMFVGVNYHDHISELPPEMRTVPSEPVVFSKLPSAVVGPEQPIVIPPGGPSHVDYEAELAVIIGRRTRNVDPDGAMDHVFGYTIVNDVSERRLQLESGQLTLGKGLDTFCPMGPCVVLTDELTDPGDLSVETRVNGEVRQRSSTSRLIFSIREIVSFISGLVTLEPGDLVATGTPAGVGAFRTPPRFLQPGDRVVVSVEGIGELANPVVAG